MNIIDKVHFKPKTLQNMRLPLLSLLLIFGLLSNAQVRDIKSKIKKDKDDDHSDFQEYYHQSSSAQWSPPDIGEGIANFIAGSLVYFTGYGIYKGLDYGQSFMQYRRDKHPETFSFQGDLTSGFNIHDNTLTLSPSLRFNWGLFASDLRYVYTDDVTGSLNSLDWQVVKLRAPLKNIKFEYGIGFSHVFSPSKTYFEQSTGFDWCFFNRTTTLQGEYRWSQETSEGERYRQEVETSLDVEAGRIGGFRFAPLVGFTFQDYFGSTQFSFIRIGIRLRYF